jgi:hypothetical protein
MLPLSQAESARICQLYPLMLCILGQNHVVKVILPKKLRQIVLTLKSSGGWSTKILFISMRTSKALTRFGDSVSKALMILKMHL